MASDEEADELSNEDLGEPITLLAGHAVPAPGTLMSRVRGSIFRRTFAGDVTRFATWGPFTVLMELLKAIFESFRGEHRTPTADESEEG